MMKLSKTPTVGSRCASIIGAAMALTASGIAQADLAPERGVIAYKHLDYKDSQPGDDRIRVKANSAMLLLPIAGEWALNAIYTTDSISGASPAFHSKQLTDMEDFRRAYDLKLTHYMSRGTLTVGTSYSREHDYASRGFSVQGSVSSEDKNTTFTAGVGVTNDRINPSNLIVDDEKKHVTDWLVGVTQVLTPADIVQFNIGYSDGYGYFSDPYKVFDERPRERDHTTYLVRWNHYYDSTKGVSHLSYRHYWDSYDIRAETLTAEYVQPLSHGWTIAPLVRYHTQTAAKFYLDVEPNSGALPTFPAFDAKYFSEDQRLSAYGALTLGIKVSKEIDQDWTVDFKYEEYRQKGSWAWSEGSPGLDTFRFRSFQYGISRKF